MSAAADDRYPSPRALLEKYGHRAKKSWGQNFLGDEQVLADIARVAAPSGGARVVELGAGLGHLTFQLLRRGAQVVAVERDREMAEVLRGELGGAITLVEADAVTLAYGPIRSGFPAAPGATIQPREASAHGEQKLTVAGNLPYHLTSPILFSLLDQLEHVERAVFLLQREVAERLAAEPGSREWGLLSVLLQREADVSVERIVKPGAFFPPPKVESAVLCALFRRPASALADPARFRRLVKAGFGQRRKTLANALKAGNVAPAGALAAALAAASIDPARRGETLTVEEWSALDRALGECAAP
jgi:16S rRNA (adenine1518-N6/adenine1519-N6)-dimethyltransferase